MNLARIESLPLVAAEPTVKSELTEVAGETSALSSFDGILGHALQQANSADLAATKKVEALASGAIDDLHGTMISVKEADISIRLVGTVRNKILDAFQELWRTSV
jgi:flagellar hook-basal body complex protein FliE